MFFPFCCISFMYDFCFSFPIFWIVVCMFVFCVVSFFVYSFIFVYFLWFFPLLYSFILYLFYSLIIYLFISIVWVSNFYFFFIFFFRFYTTRKCWFLNAKTVEETQKCVRIGSPQRFFLRQHKHQKNLVDTEIKLVYNISVSRRHITASR